MITISPRLKQYFEVANSHNDPFNFTFSPEELAKAEDWDEGEQFLIKAINTLHALFLQSHMNTRELLSSTRFSASEIIDEIMVMGNRHILLLFQRVDAQLAEPVGMVDFERLKDMQVSNGMGKMESAQQSAEILIDLYSMLITFHKRYAWLDLGDTPQVADAGYSREQLVQRLVLCINIVFNARIAFNSIVYSEVGVSLIGEEGIRLGPEKDGLPQITSANEIRSAGRFNELFFPMMHAFRKRKVKKMVIDDAEVVGNHMTLRWKKTMRTMEYEGAVISRMAIFYPHLEDLRLAAFKDTSVLDLLFLLHSLSEIVGFMRLKYEKSDLEAIDPPFRMKKTQLIEYLSSATDMGTDIVHLFLSSLINPSEHEVDLYRFPLMEDDRDYLLCFPALNAPLTHPFVARWLLASGIDNAQQTILLRNFVKKDLEGERPKNKKSGRWKIVESVEFPESLAIETEENFVAIDFLCPSYTINSWEERMALKKYSAFFLQRTQLISDFADKTNLSVKKFIRICITSDMHYSGLQIAGIPVLDLILFKNYLVVGKYQKVKMFNDPEMGYIKDLYDLPYYLNEKEFEIGMAGFFYDPVPIRVLTSKMKAKQIPLLPDGFGFVMEQTVFDLVTLEEEEHIDLADLDGMLKRKYFIKEDNPLATHAINSLISKIFAKVADSQRNDLEVTELLISAIRTSKRISSEQLLIYIIIKSSGLKHLQFTTDNIFKWPDYDPETLGRFYGELRNRVFIGNVQLSNFQLSEKLEEDDRRKLCAFLFDGLGGLVYREFDELMRTEIYASLVMLSGLISTGAEYNLFFLAAGNFIENLNLNKHFQTAREAAQECWIFAAKNKKHIQGLNILFKCYIKQKNILYSGVYGGILMAAIDSEIKIDKAVFIDVQYNLLRFFREFGYNEAAKGVWKASQKIKLKTYDEQKFTLAYLSLRLSDGVKTDKDLQQAVAKYVKKNLKELVSFGDIAIGPWISLCASIKRQCNILGVEVNGSLIEIGNVLEKSIRDAAVLENLKYQVEGEAIDPRQRFTEMLANVFEDEYFEDYKYDVMNLRPIADNAFVAALEKGDMELLLLTSLVYNDQRLFFADACMEGKMKPFGKGNKENKITENYIDHVFNGLALKENQLLLWLLELNGEVYRVILTGKGGVGVLKLDEWDIERMVDWIRGQLPKFYFNSQRNKYYDFAEQMEVENKLIFSLKAFDLRIDESFSEIFILKSVDMSSYPDNLLVSNGKLVSSSVPICNILNLEHFIAGRDKIIMPLKKINAWLPKEGEDATISFGHDELRPVLEAEQSLIIDKKTIERMPEGDLNVFLAHGTTGLDGFKYFQSEDRTYHYRTDIFGSGTVAILFICSSGNLHEDFQSQDIRSIGQDLILQGYKAVIAPFWKYDVTMAKLWLAEFFKIFKEGYSISESVHLSNRKVTEYDVETGRMFLEPAGWAAMHLYGNPDLYYGRLDQ